MTKLKIKNLNENESKIWKKNISALNSRLTWRCHFIQKLEDLRSIEWKNIHPIYDELERETSYSENFEKWKSGKRPRQTFNESI